MTTTFINGIQNTSEFLDGNDTLHVIGSLQLTSGTAIVVNGTLNLCVIAGSVLTGGGQGMSMFGQNNVVSILEGGILSQSNSAQTGTALYMAEGSGLLVENAGTITGAYGVYFDMAITDSILVNAGRITGTYYASNNGAGFTSAAAGTLVENAGAISGRSYGVNVAGNDTRFVNDGRIAGNVGVLVGAKAEMTLDNAGVIVGRGGTAIDSGGSLKLTNSGLIHGDVKLGAGSQTYAAAGEGRVLGVVSGEGGGDILRGARAADTLAGGGGNDVLRGGRGDDVLRGGEGGDILAGGRDDDMLTGHGGSDTFVFNRRAGEDEITDFQNGKDKVDLSAFTISNVSKLITSGALASDGSGGSMIDLDRIGGDGLVLIADMALCQWDNGDFVF